MEINIIVCVNKKNCIGKNNNLLCFLPSDLKNFKKVTKGSVVIMGRKTFESLPNGALPNRTNIVITRDKNFSAPNVHIVNNIEDCLSFCANELKADVCFVIGGGSIYKEFLEKKYVNKVIMTRANNDIEGDVYFPMLDENEWRKKTIEREFFDERDECEYDLIEFYHI
jgi:dihydrofolate reductase